MSWIKVKSEYNDLDKYEDDNGDIFYCKKDTALLHNSYSPAIVCENGYKAYYIDNKKLEYLLKSTEYVNNMCTRCV